MTSWPCVRCPAARRERQLSVRLRLTQTGSARHSCPIDNTLSYSVDEMKQAVARKRRMKYVRLHISSGFGRNVLFSRKFVLHDKTQSILFCNLTISSTKIRCPQKSPRGWPCVFLCTLYCYRMSMTRADASVASENRMIKKERSLSVQRSAPVLSGSDTTSVFFSAPGAFSPPGTCPGRPRSRRRLPDP